MKKPLRLFKGLKHNAGRFIFSNGDEYNGEFNKGTFAFPSTGTYKFANGRILTMEWDNTRGLFGTRAVNTNQKNHPCYLDTDPYLEENSYGAPSPIFLFGNDNLIEDILLSVDKALYIEWREHGQCIICGGSYHFFWRKCNKCGHKKGSGFQ